MHALATLIALSLASPAAPLDWHPDLSSAEAAAEESGRAMLIVFR
ncbi:MAG: hypothetical protein ACYTGJ_10020 [Planctomycetota bacterium]|jgi:hypothetical protein